MYLAMTTNERMNAGRYKHFHRKHGEIKSPFHKGVLQNLIDVAGITNIYLTDQKTLELLISASLLDLIFLIILRLI